MKRRLRLSSPPVTQAVRKEQGSAWAGLGWAGRGTATPWRLWLAPGRQAWPDAPRSQAAPTGKREEAPSGLPKLPTTLSVLVDVPAALIKHCGPKQTLGNCSILKAVGVGKNEF